MGNSLLDKVKQTNTMEKLVNATGAGATLKMITNKLSCGSPMQIEISKLEECPFPHFESYDNAKFEALKSSINNIGVQDPIRVWHQVDKNKWIILAGHHRVKACMELGLLNIPAIISDSLSEEEAKLIVNDTNNQRSWDEASLYDKCQSIIQVVDASKKLYEDGKLKEYINPEEKFDSTEEASGYFGLNRTQIYLYIKIGKSFRKEYYAYFPKHFNLKTAYELALLDKKTLVLIFETLKKNLEQNIIIKIDKNKVEEISELVSKGEPEENIKSALLGLTKKQSTKINNQYVVDFEKDSFKKYKEKIESISKDELESLILNALKEYFD